jgi:hypothetical protein
MALFVWAPILDSVLSEYPDVKLVVHASARDHSTADWITARLGALGKRVIGLATPRIPRWKAIKQYLAVNPQISSYRILDDAAGEFPTGLPQLILCKPNLGISEQMVQRQIQNWLHGE